tara:strand:- start:1054 stop:1449 length:396 start_codon:yes stop_codon:yes gene_type:complete
MALTKLLKKGIKKVVKKKTTPKKKPMSIEARKKAKATKKKTNQLLAAYKPADSAGGGARKHYDKDIVKKAAANIARIAKKRGITQREFRKNNVNNVSVRTVYNNNPNIVIQDGGFKLFDELEGDPRYTNIY